MCEREGRRAKRGKLRSGLRSGPERDGERVGEEDERGEEEPALLEVDRHGGLLCTNSRSSHLMQNFLRAVVWNSSRVQRGEFIQRRLPKVAEVSLKTTDLSVIAIITPEPRRDLPPARLPGAVDDEQLSKVQYGAEMRERTCFTFDGTCSRGELTWDRFLFVQSLFQRLNIRCQQLQTLQARSRSTSASSRAPRQAHATPSPTRLRLRSRGTRRTSTRCSSSG